MLYLILAIACSSLITICMRAGEKHIRHTMPMFTVNYLVCLALAGIYSGKVQLAQEGAVFSIGLGIGSGILFLLNFVLLQKNIHASGVVLSNASMKLGAVLLPVLIAVVLFREAMGPGHIVGAVLAVGAILLINLDQTEQDPADDSGPRRMKAGLLLLLCVSGITESMANFYEHWGAEGLKNQYLLCTFLTAMLIALISSLIRKEKPCRADLLFGVLLGIPNYFSSRFLLLALDEIRAVIVYPVFSIGTMVAVTLVGLAVFHEKLSARKLGAIALVAAALVLLNI